MCDCVPNQPLVAVDVQVYGRDWFIECVVSKVNYGIR
jgi:hypothetical protein